MALLWCIPSSAGCCPAHPLLTNKVNVPLYLSVTQSVTHVVHSKTHSVEQSTLDDQLRSFWELEALGIQEEESTLFDDFASSVKFENGRYKVALPWREFHDPLPDNHQLSVNRLQGLLQRLKQEPAILEEMTV